jgi:uncharacterized protein (TIGR01777 family)
MDVKIILAGGSGFLGQALQARLQRDGHAVANLSRHPRPDVQEDLPWTPDGTSGPWAAALEGADAVINLAGEGIADERWTDERKLALRTSRVLSTRSVVVAIRGLTRPPAVLLNGSAIGYYGARGDEVVTESTPPGADFLADLCVEWEREAEQASPVTRVVLLRTGLVLHPDGGVLARMLLPFRMGVGGPLGSGTQYMPWIHRDDWVDMAVWLITNPHARGAYNATAPAPVSNADFTRALGRALHRPTFLPVPGFALRVALGEIATSILIGQRAIPARAEEAGFQFRFTNIDAAFADLVR